MIVTPIIVLIAIGTIGNAIHPTLIKEHPLWLVAMEPRNRWVVLVAGKVSFWPLLVVGTVRRLLSDPLFYLLGYLYKDRALRWAERQFEEIAPVIRGIERVYHRAAPVLVFLFPGMLICVLAGATGMNPVLFAVLNVIGTMVTVTLLYQFASVVEGPVEAINDFYGNNFRWLTVVAIVLTAVWFLGQWRRGKSGIQSMTNLERELEGDDPPPPAA